MMRTQLSDKAVEVAIKMLETKLYDRLAQKGWDSWVSSHEILGLATEEYAELIEAVHSNNLVTVTQECLDLAVVCVFAVACLEGGREGFEQL